MIYLPVPHACGPGSSYHARIGWIGRTVTNHLRLPLFGATSIGGFFPDFWSAGCPVRWSRPAESGLSARNHPAPRASVICAPLVMGCCRIRDVFQSEPRSPPPAFTLASPSPGRGGARVKAGGGTLLSSRSRASLFNHIRSFPRPVATSWARPSPSPARQRIAAFRFRGSSAFHRR